MKRKERKQNLQKNLFGRVRGKKEFGVRGGGGGWGESKRENQAKKRDVRSKGGKKRLKQNVTSIKKKRGGNLI